MNWENNFDALVEAHIRLPNPELEIKANGKKFIREVVAEAIKNYKAELVDFLTNKGYTEVVDELRRTKELL